MTFLAPLYLLLAGAIAVPLLIHLLRRRIGSRVEFPAARYLARAEQEHSRTLKLRNLLLMLLRVLALLAIAVAAARPVARWMGAGHAPTALALVVDPAAAGSRRAPRGSTAHALDAARCDRRALPGARFHELPHDTRWTHVRARDRGAERGGCRARRAARTRMGRRHHRARARRIA